MIDIYKTYLPNLLIKLQRLTMRQRNKKIVLVEQMFAYPTQTHSFVQHDEEIIPMQICPYEKKHFGELAQIFYEAIVTEPMNNKSTNITKTQNESLLVLKDRSTKKNSDFSDLTKRWEQKGIQEVQFAKIFKKLENSQETSHKKSSSSRIEKNEQSFRSYRSVSFSSDKKQPSSKYSITQNRCLSARKPIRTEKENAISDFTCSSSSGKKIVKNIKYSVLPAKKMI